VELGAVVVALAGELAEVRGGLRGDFAEQLEADFAEVLDGQYGDVVRAVGDVGFGELLLGGFRGTGGGVFGSALRGLLLGATAAE